MTAIYKHIEQSNLLQLNAVMPITVEREREREHFDKLSGLTRKAQYTASTGSVYKLSDKSTFT